MVPANGAMRQGILYDLLGRFHHKDMRDITVAQFMHRYHVDVLQARRVGTLAYTLLRKLSADSGELGEAAVQGVAWAAKLHEIGISVAYGGYHKHSAYIVGNADMPGFSRDEQARLSLLVQAHRRSLHKIAKQIDELDVGWDMVFSLRLAALFCRSRSDVAPSSLQVRRQGKRFRVSLGKEWLRRNPLTATALLDEMREWDGIGFELRMPELEEFEAAGELALAS
jgi:exopolyphosphatase/guanosine-5'-triphosphate,3'-diphosphate pyrophosphatase